MIQPRRDFNRRVYALVRQIPSGKVVSYGDVAAAMGQPGAARQVGRALSALAFREPEGPPVPWQRVILQSGDLAFRGDPVRCAVWSALLRGEGVEVVDDRVVMARFRWRPEPGDWMDPDLEL